MRGGIYSEQRCKLCGGRFRDDGRKGLFCPNHTDQWATRFRVKFKGVYKRFDNYREAQRFLTGLRFQHDQGVFDVRDWKREHPLGFATLARKWLDVRKGQVKPKTHAYYTNYINKAIEVWGQRSIREIGYAEIEEFLMAQAVSAKTRANMNGCLHAFWNWVRKRRVLALHQMPEFPDIPFELGFRKTVDKQTQQAIIDEVHRISFHINPRVWIGIRFLATYISVRPGELLRVKEEDIDLINGLLSIPYPKEKKPKIIPLLEEDIELLRTIPRGLPHLHFFRHNPSYSCREGKPFGEKHFYKWWKRACANLGIQKVDLYGGTRHSSARALRKHHSPEAIRKATLHSTNKAFERYFCFENEDVRAVYADTRMKTSGTVEEEEHEKGTRLAPENRTRKKAKILKLK